MRVIKDARCRECARTVKTVLVALKVRAKGVLMAWMSLCWSKKG